ncbi:DUF5058 family protein [Mobilitalea sibirica]|uniref:DUF5058 family protein n=1 Tax=Mobilitalea sibirica TaxID=1462919 RepID=A0A8J7H3R1_9FIRM|nr:DUF5058 family protein [Mobilitalea sibirica]MBH1941822.1 DUF5058 family protein [Mobilitalea sibirica]
MVFNPNSGFLYIIAVIMILFVIAQSLFFLIRAYRRARTIGMDMAQVRKTIISTAIFTIAPAVSILLGVVTLSKFIGLPLPWIRLSVIGAITYELPAATTTANALGISLSETIVDPRAYSAIAWVMTLGIIPSIVLVPILLKRIQKGILSIKNKDSKWGDLFITAMFLGMIAAFLGMVFSDVRNGLVGWIPIFVLLFSALLMGISGLLIKVCKMKWLQNYALPFSMLGAMAFAAVITPIIVK